VIHPDGYVELFARRGTVRVHVANLLDVAHANEPLAQELAELQMPAWARELYYPAYCVATASTNECWDVGTEVERQWGLEFLRTLKGVNNDTASKP